MTPTPITDPAKLRELEDRIARFQNMVQANGQDNEMAHFSLGNALLQAGRFRDAAASFENAIRIVPDMSKAYQLAGESWFHAGDHPRAAAVLRQGYTIAGQKGDLMPKTAMGKLLKQLGEDLPDVQPTAGPAAAPGYDPAAPLPPGMILDAKTGRPGTKMPRPPFKGPIGRWIHDHVSQETWTAWIGQGTKVINELRLDLSRDKDQETYDQHMHEYLGLDDATLASLRAPATP